MTDLVLDKQPGFNKEGALFYGRMGKIEEYRLQFRPYRFCI